MCPTIVNQSINQVTPTPGQAKSRREALKILGATGGAATIAAMSGQWAKPLVEVGLLPAHAQVTGHYTQTFTTSGQFTVPAGVTRLTVDAYGAEGGKGFGGLVGGLGGRTQIVITVTPGELLHVQVGGQGTAGTAGPGGGGAGGSGGGGAGGGGPYGGGGGGGASSVDRGGPALVVAGGGGGAGGIGGGTTMGGNGTTVGGNAEGLKIPAGGGGGTTGGAGGDSPDPASGGGGGSQVDGGAGGTGHDGPDGSPGTAGNGGAGGTATVSLCEGGGGGGGGYYGGGGGEASANQNSGGGGGGGSSYPAGATHTQSARSGDGQVILAW